MDIEFHYYVTYILAKEAKFDHKKASIIAHASQYVDDNSCIFKINKGKPNEYQNYISQTMNITKPKKKLMRIYPFFHFIPGNPLAPTARRKDGAMHLLNTTPNSKIANALLDDALASGTGNLYRIGIASHSYMDTWAHQNFLGDFDDFNSMQGLKEKLSPNIGHADAGHDPDIPGLVWKDRRLVTENRVVYNKQRFLDASRALYSKYRKALDKRIAKETITSEWRSLRRKLANAIGDEAFEDSDDRREKRIDGYMKLTDGLSKYDHEEWFKDSVETDVKGLPDFWDAITIFPDKHLWKTGYKQKHWFRFQQAVKKHQEVAENLLLQHYKQIEIQSY